MDWVERAGVCWTEAGIDDSGISETLVGASAGEDGAGVAAALDEAVGVGREGVPNEAGVAREGVPDEASTLLLPRRLSLPLLSLPLPAPPS